MKVLNSEVKKEKEKRSNPNEFRYHVLDKTLKMFKVEVQIPDGNFKEIIFIDLSKIIYLKVFLAKTAFYNFFTTLAIIMVNLEILENFEICITNFYVKVLQRMVKRVKDALLSKKKYIIVLMLKLNQI